MICIALLGLGANWAFDCLVFMFECSQVKSSRVDLLSLLLVLAMVVYLQLALLCFGLISLAWLACCSVDSSQVNTKSTGAQSYIGEAQLACAQSS